MMNLAFKNVHLMFFSKKSQMTNEKEQKNLYLEFINLPNPLEKSPPVPLKPSDFSTQDVARIQFQNKTKISGYSKYIIKTRDPHS